MDDRKGGTRKRKKEFMVTYLGYCSKEWLGLEE
jgi:hypothetical protein